MKLSECRYKEAGSHVSTETFDMSCNMAYRLEHI